MGSTEMSTACGCRTRRRGAAGVMVVVVLVTLFGFMALSVDVGHLYVIKGELQNAADGAAMAATGNLSGDYFDAELLAMAAPSVTKKTSF